MLRIDISNNTQPQASGKPQNSERLMQSSAGNKVTPLDIDRMKGFETSSVEKTDMGRPGSPNTKKSPKGIMSARTLDESLHGSYQEDAKDRRLKRLSSTGSESKDKDLRVRMHKVQIREYPIVLGNNPGVSRGPPLTIDWEHCTHEEFDFEEYESVRPPRRTQVEMYMPLMVREHILKQSGFTRKEIREAVRITNISRNKRKQTIDRLNLSRAEETLESAQRKLRKLLSFNSKKRKEERYISNWNSVASRAAAAISEENAYYENRSECSSITSDSKIVGTEIDLDSDYEEKVNITSSNGDKINGDLKAVRNESDIKSDSEQELGISSDANIKSDHISDKSSEAEEIMSNEDDDLSLSGSDVSNDFEPNDDDETEELAKTLGKISVM